MAGGFVGDDADDDDDEDDVAVVVTAFSAAAAAAAAAGTAAGTAAGIAAGTAAAADAVVVMSVASYVDVVGTAHRAAAEACLPHVLVVPVHSVLPSLQQEARRSSPVITLDSLGP